MKKRVLSILVIFLLVTQMMITIQPLTATAATVTLYPSTYTYVKPVPFWTSDPFDQFSTTQQVTILERDYDFFYIQYTKDGQVRRGYASVSSFNAADYAGYSWCTHNYFTTGYNNSGVAQTTYYGPTGTYSSGAIDADEGSHTDKPILVLRYESGRAFIQYVTNPGEAGTVKFKRAWVNSGCITVSPPAAFNIGSNYTLIKNASTGKYLQAGYAAGSYTLSEGNQTGYEDQQWEIMSFYTANGGNYYKIRNVSYDVVLEIDGGIPVVNSPVTLEPEIEPDKSQHFAFQYVSANTYKILTRTSGNYFAVQSNGGNNPFQAVKKSSSTAQNWIFEPMNRCWANSYNNLTYSGGKAVLLYYIDTSTSTGISNAGLNVTQVLTAASYWNNVNADLTLTRTITKSQAKIIITTTDSEEGFLGQTLNNIGNTMSNWDYSTIEINATSDPSKGDYVIGLEDSEKIKLICHEMGHALKLQHPYGEGPKAINESVYSVMNQGMPGYTLYPLVTGTPSQYDHTTLKLKWGGI